MRRSFKASAVLPLTLLLFAASARAQPPDAASREAEWKSHKVPSTEFARYTDSSKALVVRVPVEWKQQGSELVFTGADGIELQIIIDEIPDGIPLRSYIASLTQGLRSLPDGPDSVVTRRTQVAGLEAREIMFEITDARGASTRRVIWSTVDGPRAISFILFAPLARAAQAESYFKGVVQSVIVTTEFAGASFDELRAGVIKESKPARVDEVQGLTATIDGTDVAARARAVARLAEIYKALPDAAIDLLIDKRSLVRAAAFEAIGLSGNRSLFKLLARPLLETWRELDIFVQERAARALASLPDAVSLLREETHNWASVDAQAVSNAAAFLDEKARVEIAAEIFKAASTRAASGTVTIEGLPPAAQRKSTKQPAPKSSKAPQKKTPPEFKMIPGLPPPEVEPGGFTADVTVASDLFHDRRFVALNLLRRISPSSFKLPLADIIKIDNNRLTAAALEVALERREILEVEPLMKLITSPDEEVVRLAALHLGERASEAEIPRISDQALKLDIQSRASTAKSQPSVNSRSSKSILAEELRAAIKKIRLREQLSKATGDARKQTLAQAMTDEQIADWVWREHAREKIDATQKTKLGEVSPLGENIFPANVKLYVALPDPSTTINKFTGALGSLQMETARSQADLVLMLSAIKEQIEQLVGAPPEASPLDYLGIKMGAPIAAAAWNVEGAPTATASARRSAVVLRVSDRDRFERLIALYQQVAGNFRYLPDYLSIGARFIGLAPALLPFSAANYLKLADPRAPEPRDFKYFVVGRDESFGYAVKIFERREIKRGAIIDDSIYLAYVGDAAVMAPDRDSLDDLLARLANSRAALSENADFKRAVATGGDAIYFSNLGEVFATSKKKEAVGALKLTESGALKFSNTAWENSYRISFGESAWAAPLVPFHPRDLSAPRELLPRSTIAYFFMKLDAAAAWREWAADLFTGETIKEMASIWAIDFEKEVLTELGPEAGAALLAIPTFNDERLNAPWIIYFKLRSDKLPRAADEKKLFKSDAKWPFAVVKNGYLILADSRATIDRLDGKEKLAESRDFTRASRNAPENVIAFGGYNLEAAIAEVSAPSNDLVAQQIVSAMTSVAKAFHSQNFYALADKSQVFARMSVSLDREGRYSVADLSSAAKDFRLTFAVIEPGGIPIADQNMLKHLKMNVGVKAADAVDRIKEDLSVNGQTVEKTASNQLTVTIRPRKFDQSTTVQLPVAGAELAPFLVPTREIRSDDKSVIDKAREIVGDDRDGWSVARKLSDWTYKNLKWRRVDYATAAQTLATLQADCLEFSQLFVAMARSLGLPARIVTGFAYNSSSFGAHAWVEVYVRRWVELDPTFGTDFVDATHIREATGDTVGYAALNLVSMEVEDAPREVMDYQRDAGRLAEKLVEEMAAGKQSAIAVALDIAALADERLGAGAWARMSDRDREQMGTAYRRLLTELANGFRKQVYEQTGLRLLRVDEAGDRAEALLIHPVDFEDTLVRLKLSRKDGVWMLAELIREDVGIELIADYFEAALQAITDARVGKQNVRAQPSVFLRALALINQEDKTAVELLDEALKSDPKNRRLRYLKAMALMESEQTDEAVKLLTEMSNEGPPVVSAIFKLAEHHSISYKDEDKKKAIELYERYIRLQPYDPRPHARLADLYEAGDAARAEAERRAAIERDPRETDNYIKLAALLAGHNRYKDAIAALSEGSRYGRSKDEMVAEVLSIFYDHEKTEAAEGLVAAGPELMRASAGANYYLALMRMNADRAQDAVPLLKKAISISPNESYLHSGLARCYRNLRNWPAALKAADAAIKIDSEDGAAYYHRACALARLGRKVEAMAALKRAVELEVEEDLEVEIKDEPDLKPLAAMPQFKKLLVPKENDDK